MLDAAAIEEFKSWLRFILKNPEGDLDRWAEYLINQQDWSASYSIEVSRYQTRTGNPEIYTFDWMDVLI